jgi:hypothetical protein
MNYSAITRNKIGDINRGLLVQTSVFNNLTYFHQDQWEVFLLKGRIMLLQLFMEAITDAGGGASLLQFNYTFTDPAITVKPLAAVSGSIAAYIRGSRCVWVGGAVASSMVETVATGGCSDVICAAPVILGGKGFVGSIGMVTTIANGVSGTSQIVATYVPMSDGASLLPNI